jgi:hypothetical protein
MKKNNYVLTQPKDWDDAEIYNLLELSKTLTVKQIAAVLNRSVVSVSIKLKRLKKKSGQYNEKHLQEKYNLNDNFIQTLKPETVLDVFSGSKSYYSKWENIKVVTNDINQDFECDYYFDYLKLLGKLYCEDNKYDLVDLDPFGSAFDGLDLAIKMAKRGLIVTLGEMGHQRFKRLDFVRHRYGINRLEDFTVQALVEKIKSIGLANKKQLTLVYLANWPNISRAYFTIQKHLVTEQWDDKNDDAVSLFDEEQK